MKRCWIALLLASPILAGCPARPTTPEQIADAALTSIQRELPGWVTDYNSGLQQKDPAAVAKAQINVLGTAVKWAMYAHFSATGRWPASLGEITALLPYEALTSGEERRAIPLQAQRSTLGTPSIQIELELGLARLTYWSGAEDITPLSVVTADAVRSIQSLGPYLPARSDARWNAETYGLFVKRQVFTTVLNALVLKYAQTTGQLPESWEEIEALFSIRLTNCRMLAPTDVRLPGEAEYRLTLDSGQSVVYWLRSDFMPDGDGDGWPDWDPLASRFDFQPARSVVYSRHYEASLRENWGALKPLLRIAFSPQAVDRLLQPDSASLAGATARGQASP